MVQLTPRSTGVFTARFGIGMFELVEKAPDLAARF